MKFRYALARCSLLVVFLVALHACTKKTDDLHSLTLLPPTGQRIDLRVEIADDNEERSRGLMFREELPVGQGMFFIFDELQILSFWMKNTRIPLDILFFDAGGEFVSAMTMEPCEKDPCRIYSSGGEAQYALEVPAGFMQRYGIVEGWSIFPLPAPARRSFSEGGGEG